MFGRTLFLFFGAAWTFGCIRFESAPPGLRDGAPCYSSTQCNEGSVCDEGICQLEGGCRSETQCGAGEVCDFGSCRQEECEAGDVTGACGPYTCVNSLCITSCGTDSACSSGHVCRRGMCVDERCDDSNAALVCDGSSCDVATGRCRGAWNCREHGCARGYVCDSGCRKPCGGDGDCAPYRCSRFLKTCDFRCFDNSDCQGGFTCEQGACLLHP